MMLLLHSNVYKIGDEFGHNFLKEIREKHIKDIVTMFFYGRPRKIIVSKKQIQSPKALGYLNLKGAFHIK